MQIPQLLPLVPLKGDLGVLPFLAHWVIMGGMGRVLNQEFQQPQFGGLPKREIVGTCLLYLCCCFGCQAEPASSYHWWLGVGQSSISSGCDAPWHHFRMEDAIFLDIAPESLKKETVAARTSQGLGRRAELHTLSFFYYNCFLSLLIVNWMHDRMKLPYTESHLWSIRVSIVYSRPSKPACGSLAYSEDHFTP